MDNNSKALQILIVLKAIEAFLLDIAPEGVSVSRTQSSVFVTGLDSKRLNEVKALGARFAANAYPARTYKHSKARGFRTWRTNLNDLRCGIDVVRTEAETFSIICGPVRGVNC